MRAGDTMAQPVREIPKTTEELAACIVAFGEELTKVDDDVPVVRLYPYQYAFAIAIVMTILNRDGKAITALFSRQSGKTETVAIVALACAILLPAFAKMFPHDKRVLQYKRGFWVGIYAPKDEQAKLAFDRVRKYATSKAARGAYEDQDLTVELESTRSDMVSWSSGSKIRARTASDNSMSEGDTWDLLICDESQAISTDKVNKELKPMLQRTGGPMVLIGTTGGAAGHFHRRIKLNLEEEREYEDRRHFEANYLVVIRHMRERYEEEVQRWNKFCKATARQQAAMLENDSLSDQMPDEGHLNYDRKTNATIAEFGGIEKAELDETFQLNYMLMWGVNSLIAIPPSAWKSLAIPSLEINTTGVKGFLVAGLDLAKGANEGSDESVLSILHVDVNRPIVDRIAAALPGQDPIKSYMKTLIGLYSFRGDFENFQNDAVVQVCRMYPGIRRLVVDSNGIGDPVASRLTALLPEIEVEGLSWASINNKSLCYKLLLMAIRGQHFRYAAGPTTRTTKEFKRMDEQILGLQKKFVGSGSVMVCEAQEGEHDDYPDSLSFACYAADQALDLDVPSMDTIECSDFFMPSRHQQQYDGAATRADSYRSGRRGHSRYDVHRM